MSSLAHAYVTYGGTVVGVIIAVVYQWRRPDSHNLGDYYLPVMIGVFFGTGAGVLISSMFPLSP